MRRMTWSPLEPGLTRSHVRSARSSMDPIGGAESGVTSTHGSSMKGTSVYPRGARPGSSSRSMTRMSNRPVRRAAIPGVSSVSSMRRSMPGRASVRSGRAGMRVERQMVRKAPRVTVRVTWPVSGRSALRASSMSALMRSPASATMLPAGVRIAPEVVRSTSLSPTSSSSFWICWETAEGDTMRMSAAATMPPSRATESRKGSRRGSMSMRTPLLSETAR